MDRYGVPVYASRKGGGEEALAVEVEVAPPAVGGVEPHDVGSVLVQSNVGNCFLNAWLLFIVHTLVRFCCTSLTYHVDGSAS